MTPRFSFRTEGSIPLSSGSAASWQSSGVSCRQNCPWLSSHLVHGHGSFLGAAYIQWLVDMRHESTFCPNWGQLRGPSSFRVLCGADWGPCRNCITAPAPVFFLPFLQKKGCSSDYSHKHSAHYCAPVHLNCLLEEASLESNKLLPFK